MKTQHQVLPTSRPRHKIKFMKLSLCTLLLLLTNFGLSQSYITSYTFKDDGKCGSQSIPIYSVLISEYFQNAEKLFLNHEGDSIMRADSVENFLISMEDPMYIEYFNGFEIHNDTTYALISIDKKGVISPVKFYLFSSKIKSSPLNTLIKLKLLSDERFGDKKPNTVYKFSRSQLFETYISLLKDEMMRVDDSSDILYSSNFNNFQSRIGVLDSIRSQRITGLSKILISYKYSTAGIEIDGIGISLKDSRIATAIQVPMANYIIRKNDIGKCMNLFFEMAGLYFWYKNLDSF